MKSKKQIIAACLTASLCTAAVPSAFAAQTFSDVPQDGWAYSAITSFTEQGIVSGFADGTFQPNGNVTREQFAKLLCLTMGIQTDSSDSGFSDVSGWSAPYIAAAKPYLAGMTDTTFAPRQAATRLQIVVALMQSLGGIASTGASNFLDISTLPAVQQNAIAQAVQLGIINGYPDGTFRPNASITRAETVVMLQRAQALQNDAETPETPSDTPAETPSDTPATPSDTTTQPETPSDSTQTAYLTSADVPVGSNFYAYVLENSYNGANGADFLAWDGTQVYQIQTSSGSAKPQKGDLIELHKPNTDTLRYGVRHGITAAVTGINSSRTELTLLDTDGKQYDVNLTNDSTVIYVDGTDDNGAATPIEGGTISKSFQVNSEWISNVYVLLTGDDIDVLVYDISNTIATP